MSGTFECYYFSILARSNDENALVFCCVMAILVNYGCQPAYRFNIKLKVYMFSNINMVLGVCCYFFFFLLSSALSVIYNLDKCSVISNLLMANKSLVWAIINKRQINGDSLSTIRYLKRSRKRDIYVYLHWSMFGSFFALTKCFSQSQFTVDCCKQKSNYNQNIKWLSSS